MPGTLKQKMQPARLHFLVYGVFSGSGKDALQILESICVKHILHCFIIAQFPGYVCQKQHVIPGIGCVIAHGEQKDQLDPFVI